MGSWCGRIIEWDSDDDWVAVEADDAGQAAELVAYIRIGDSTVAELMEARGLTAAVREGGGEERTFSITVDWTPPEVEALRRPYCAEEVNDA